MVVRIIEENNSIKLSVRDLVSTLESSSIVSSRVLFSLRMGQNAHRTHQESRKEADESYLPEYSVSYEMTVDNWYVRITGRVDAAYKTSNGFIIEEYKSVPWLDSFKEIKDIPLAWVRQTQIYGHILAEQGYSIKARLLLIALGTNKTKTFEIPIKNQQGLIESKIRDIIHNFNVRKQQNLMKKQYADSLEFPFREMRKHQDKLINRIFGTLESGERFLYSAPTGMGKTVGSLYPALRFALKKGGMKVFFVTAKTTQQIVTGRTFQQIVEKSPGIYVPKGIVLQAKEKLCPLDELLCRDELCPLASNYTEVDIAEVINQVLEDDLILPKRIAKIADAAEICPFELSLDISLECDVVICDYNYVFHPTVVLKRFFQDKRNSSNYILIVDEAQNLLDRARNYYSPELRRGIILSCRVQATRLGNDRTYIGIRRITENLLSYLSALQKYDKPLREEMTYLVDVDGQTFRKLFDEYEEFTRQHLSILIEKGLIPNSLQDPILRFYSQFKDFISILEVVPLLRDLFSQIYDETSGVLKILCKDPSPLLGRQISQFWSVIAQSATLEPLEFYRDLLGFPKDCACESFPSPFPKENQFVAIYPEISTRLSDRQRTLEALCNIIEVVLGAKNGNYFVFLPSFRYLNMLEKQLSKRRMNNLGFQLLFQEPMMDERSREIILRRFEKDSGIVLVGVHGGIFAEGIDLSGESLQGVIIVGPALPSINNEQELIKDYFERKKGQNRGFEYAYRNPGMNRVIQAAGRVIRSEHDRGIVILVGDRFSRTFYNKLFPKYWGIPNELITNKKQLARDLRRFWRQSHKMENP